MGVEKFAPGEQYTLRGLWYEENELTVGCGQVRRVNVLAACLLHCSVYTRKNGLSIHKNSPKVLFVCKN